VTDLDRQSVKIIGRLLIGEQVSPGVLASLQESVDSAVTALVDSILAADAGDPVGGHGAHL
jgi:hypothetical protein